jgi:hypothetical protein
MVEPTLKDVLKAISELDAKVGRKVDELRSDMKKGFADLDRSLPATPGCTVAPRGFRAFLISSPPGGREICDPAANEPNEVEHAVGESEKARGSAKPFAF